MSTTADPELYAELRRRRRTIEGTIAGYKAKIAASERELEECLQMLQQFPQVYPILTLPNEITSEIFMHCLPSSSYLPSTPNPRNAPMLLLHICKAWRSVAISTPSLWAELRLTLDRLPRSFFEAENLEIFLADWLARVGACPLSVHLYGFLPNAEDGQRFMTTNLDRLSSHIQALTLDIPISHYPEHSLRFPRLRDLALGYNGEEDLVGLESASPIQTFSAASQLRKLDLFSGAAPSHFAVPWETLEAFTSEELSAQECADVLRLAPSLVTATFLEPLDSEVQSISHNNLKSLVISHAGDTLLQSLTFPALHDLTISSYDMKHAPLLQFISRASPSLLKLVVPAPPMQALQNMPVLTHLRLFAPETDHLTEFIRMLDRAQTPGFLPQLQVLEFTGCLPFVNLFLAMALSSRCAVAEDGAAKLRSFSQIWDQSPLTFEALQFNHEGHIGLAFKKLVQAGMEIYIGPPKPGQY
ncbi:hypothetical protein DFH08DRAFT_947935 [Mycena albidolilacea]|uniref:F-box domain-containing protein n=1 Tax=Mycena albidolilacea TaxID=1033008 RepID=A0AAD7F7E1_9AGAR|nr:hypothetical protein DFH08DRAFT_947935 [Mycena albidolilacea]